MKKKFRTFEEARSFVRKLGLENAREWEKYSKSGNKPHEIWKTNQRKRTESNEKTC